MGVASARHVAAGGGDRDQLLAGEEPVGQFDLDLGHAVALRLGEAGDPVARELDVFS